MPENTSQPAPPSRGNYKDLRFREVALGQAVKYAIGPNTSSSTASVVATAEAFRAFLAGEDKKP